MRKKTKVRTLDKILVILIVGLACMLGLVVFMSNPSEKPQRVSSAERLNKAKAFYGEREYAQAIDELIIFLQTNKDSAEAWLLLGDCYDKEGKKDAAVAACVKAANIIDAMRNYEGMTLSPTNPSLMIEKAGTIKITISASSRQTKDMYLQISPENLAPSEGESGLVSYQNDKLKESTNHFTTSWFPLDGRQGYLTMSGGFNHSAWQFKNSSGEIINLTMDESTFRKRESSALSNHLISSVKIPQDAVMARVTFVNMDTLEDTANIEIPLEIVYGHYPSPVQNNQLVQIIYFPNIEVGECIVYENGVWTLFHNKGEEILQTLPAIDIQPGYTVTMGGQIKGIMSLETEETKEESKKDGIYGIRFKFGAETISCERVADAKGLQFNYMIDDSWNSAFINDFDSIYPWSEIKLCSIDKQGNISYITDSHAVNAIENDIMVEIPVHYFRRERIGDYEYIYISGSEREGFSVDPSFDSPEGIKEKIYVAAYLSGISEGGDEINSASGENPLINLSYEDIENVISQKGEGWKEIDFSTLMMLQRLFVVEVGILNSQALFMGNTGLVWGSDISISASRYATTSSEGSVNYITLGNSGTSRKFDKGDAIVLLTVDAERGYYVYLTEYENNDNWIRKITNIEKSSNEIKIYFSGEPLEIEKNKTMIMHLPRINGETDVIPYCTGAISKEYAGLASFKYRHLENLWGNVCVFIEGITVENSIASLSYPNGDIATLNYALPIQKGSPSGNAGSEAFVKSMGFDKANPSVMLPERIGASASSLFGDAWFYPDGNSELMLTYGLTWDLRHYAGLFAYRAVSKGSAAVERGSRLMFR